MGPSPLCSIVSAGEKNLGGRWAFQLGIGCRITCFASTCPFWVSCSAVVWGFRAPRPARNMLSPFFIQLAIVDVHNKHHEHTRTNYQRSDGPCIKYRADATAD